MTVAYRADLDKLDDADSEVLRTEFKTGIRNYLENHGSPNGMGTLDDLIAFNKANHERVMPYFGQERFLQSAEKGELTDSTYAAALATVKRVSKSAIDTALAQDRLDAIIAPNNGPAWKIDLINGDNWGSAVSSSMLPALSGYPNVTVPMGEVHELPVGLAIFGAAFNEATLLQIAHAFEQATKARKSPAFLSKLDFE